MTTPTGITRASRLMTPEEIAVKAGEQVPFLRLPERASVFSDRELRLRQLAAGHPMRDYLLFVAEVAHAQHALLQQAQSVPLPDAAQIGAAAREGLPLLPADTWPRDPAWRDGLRRMLDALLGREPAAPAQEALRRLRAASDEHLERQAGRLLTGVMTGLDLATAPLVAAALQVYWTQLVLGTQQAGHASTPAPFGRIDDATRCPCCGSLPTASVVRIGADASGYRYLHCSLCASQWHMVRVKCTHCEGTKGIAYQTLASMPGHDLPATGARPGAVQAETCEECGHYLKIVHMAKDAHVEPAADDLASLTVDLLVSETGLHRHGVNLMLLFGDAEEGARASDPLQHPPDPGGG